MAQSNLNAYQQAVLKSAMELLVRIGGNDPAVMSGIDLGAQLQGVRDGIIGSARLGLATNPTANDTVVIGGHTFKFVASLGAVVTQTQVKIGADAAASRAVLVKAINGTADSVNILEGTTAFVATAYAGGWAVVADEVGSSTIRVRQCLWGYHGLTNYVQALTPVSIALSETFTDATDAWNCANLNETALAPGKRSTSGFLTITAAMITKGSFVIDLPFTPVVKSLQWDGYISTGVKRAINEAVVASAADKTITLTLAGGGSPNWQATDVFAFRISE